MHALATIVAAPLASESWLITPNVGLMVWTLVVFGISLYILIKAVFPRISAALDERRASIDESIDAAEHTREEADKILAEYRERLEEARAQSEEIVQRARQTAESHESEAKRARPGAARRSRASALNATSRRPPAARSTTSAARSPTSRCSPPRRSRARRSTTPTSAGWSRRRSASSTSPACPRAHRARGGADGGARPGIRALAVPGRARAGEARRAARAARPGRRCARATTASCRCSSSRPTSPTAEKQDGLGACSRTPTRPC